MKTPRQVYDEVSKYIVSNTSGSSYNQWYVGIASNPRARLFEDHAVDESKDYWIYINTGNDSDARNIEGALIKNLRTQGDVGGGDNFTKFVYAYLTNNHTTP